SEGLAIVSLNSKYGFIDISGKEIAPLKYEDVRKDPGEPVRVKLNNKWGFVDKTGKELTLLKYNNIGYVSWHGLYDFTVDKKHGYLDKTGKEITPLYEAVDGFAEGLGKVQSGYKIGFIDSTGKEIIPPAYGDAHSFSDGLCAVQGSNVNKWGYIDKTGKEVIPLQFDYAFSFTKDGKAKVRLKDKTFFIDKTGKEVQ
ncbi:MAG: WG repeat-containing protein, partial [Chitinophagaceae bacterium]